MPRSGRKFGNTLHEDLRRKGHQGFPVHLEAAEIDGTPCSRSLAELPKPVGGLVLVVPPAQTVELAAEAAQALIDRAWMQPGAQSPDAVRLCEQRGIREIHGERSLMLAESTGFVHRADRWIWKACGRLPK